MHPTVQWESVVVRGGVVALLHTLIPISGLFLSCGPDIPPESQFSPEALDPDGE